MPTVQSSSNGPDASKPLIISPYIGRFAPSPSGPLHFGSLVCALASYIDAKRHSGLWLVRIEDIDPPREQVGASDGILRCLENHGLCWDGPVRFQSDRSDAYLEALNWLEQRDLTYRCNCTRKRLEPLNGVYDGYCRENLSAIRKPAALRLKVRNLPKEFTSVDTRISFTDGIKGEVVEDLPESSGDFIIHRKDGYFAYQLAVVIDDIDQDITHVIRGDDLLETTGKQIYLYHLLGQKPPQYAHIPVILDRHGNKLSKQNHAPALENARASSNLLLALKALKLPCHYEESTSHLPSPQELLAEVLGNLLPNTRNLNPTSKSN